MFAHLPLPARPSGIPRLSAFWLGAAIASLALACLLLYSGQPQASVPPLAEHSLSAQFFPPAFVHAVPEIGFMSEVRESGPYLRAVATAWPVDAFVAEISTVPHDADLESSPR